MAHSIKPSPRKSSKPLWNVPCSHACKKRVRAESVRRIKRRVARLPTVLALMIAVFAGCGGQTERTGAGASASSTSGSLDAAPSSTSSPSSASSTGGDVAPFEKVSCALPSKPPPCDNPCNCGACDGAQGPPSNPRGCGDSSGVCIVLEHPERGPLASIGRGCELEVQCAQNYFACGASKDCSGTRKCCAAASSRYLRATCKDDCAPEDVELCDVAPDCASGTCESYQYSTEIPLLLACSKPARCL